MKKRLNWRSRKSLHYSSVCNIDFDMKGIISSHTLGKTGITVSDIALGTDYYGKTVSRQQAFRLLDIYIEAGGNTVDTAHVYADYLPGERHSSEKTIGQWLRERKCRKEIVISS